MSFQLCQTALLIKPLMRRGKVKIRAVINIKQNCIKFLPFLVRVKPPFTVRHGEKIPFDKTNRRVLTERFAERDEPIFMPADDRCQFFNNQHMRNPMVAKRRISRKPHAQAADDNRQRPLMPDRAKPLMCQRYFRRGE